LSWLVEALLCSRVLAWLNIAVTNGGLNLSSRTPKAGCANAYYLIWPPWGVSLQVRGDIIGFGLKRLLMWVNKYTAIDASFVIEQLFLIASR